jgi:acetyltransferase-like isoleucine patch superfamily enzyme
VALVVQPPGSLRMGRAVQLRDRCEISASGGDITLGSHVFFNRNCMVVAYRGIEIGSNCMFGPNVGIFDHDHDFSDRTRPIWDQELLTDRIVIGSDVWVGANTIITAGVRIEDRVVVGANSVVTADLPAGGLYAGSPAKLIRHI